MLPTIPPGRPLDIVCDENVTPGDVIVFLHRDEVVVHRLLQMREQWMMTRGDANEVVDAPIPRSAIVGRVVNEMPMCRESKAQRRNRRFAEAAFALGRRPAQVMIATLWLLHRLNARVQTAWALYGVRGFLARLWSRTGGRLIDMDVIVTGRFPPPPEFVPVPGYRYECVGSESPRWQEAVRMLNVDPSTRGEQLAFVAISESDGSTAACSLAERPAGPVGFNRGGTADPRHRGHSLTGSVLMHQAATLSRDGVEEVEYHVNVTNRGARRMHRKIGAREIDCWVILTLLGRFRFSRRFPFATPRVPNPS